MLLKEARAEREEETGMCLQGDPEGQRGKSKNKWLKTNILSYLTIMIAKPMFLKLYSWRILVFVTRSKCPVVQINDCVLFQFLGKKMLSDKGS